MDWLLPYYWAVGLSASGIPMTSWGLVSLPLRDPDGRCAIAASISSFLSPTTKLQIGVSTQPGETALTRIGASSSARFFVRAGSAAVSADRK